MHSSLKYQTDKEILIYLFLNNRRNEDKPKYLFLNHRRNEDKLMHSSLNYERKEKNQMYLFLNYRRNEKIKSVGSSTIDDLALPG
jgi:hypothetical protein